MADSKSDNAREAQDIAAELVRLVTRRLAEGTRPSVLAAGLALGLTLTARTHPNGKEIVDLIGECLKQAGGENAG